MATGFVIQAPNSKKKKKVLRQMIGILPNVLRNGGKDGRKYVRHGISDMEFVKRSPIRVMPGRELTVNQQFILAPR